MAFHDILRALDADADARISSARAAKQESVAQTREKLEHAASEKLAGIATEVDRKKKNMERQIVAHTQMNGRQAAMTAKRDLVEQTYAKALDMLAGMNPAQTEEFLKRMIEACPEGGVIRAAQPHEALVKKLAGKREIGAPVKGRGGFVHETDTSDRDCTYETIVRDILRPATELAVASTLFGKA